MPGSRVLCTAFSTQPRNPRLRAAALALQVGATAAKSISGYVGESIPPAGTSVGGPWPVGSTATSRGCPSAASRSY